MEIEGRLASQTQSTHTILGPAAAWWGFAGAHCKTTSLQNQCHAAKYSVCEYGFVICVIVCAFL